MAAKKKKKAAVNTRGFATTSIASKSKVDTEMESSNVSESGTTQPATPAEPSDQLVAKADPTQDKDLSQMTPDELQAHLEQGELQMLLEKLLPSVNRESKKVVSRLKTDRRVLLSQSQTVNTSEWLQDQDWASLDTLNLPQVNDGNGSIAEKKSLLKMGTAEELLSRLWILQSTLTGLFFPLSRVTEALKWICQNPPQSTTDTLPWGVQECIDWLAVQCSADELSEFEKMEKKQPIRSDSPPGAGTSNKQNSHQKSQSSTPSDSSKNQEGRLLDEETDVTDLDSDMEPSEMVEVYLSLKTKLFEIDPELFAPIKKHKARGRNNDVKDSQSSTRTRKLLKQLQTVEKDMLFDEDLAHDRWEQQQIKLLQDSAARKRLGIGKSSTKPIPAATTTPREVVDIDTTDEMDDGLLGGMFMDSEEAQPETQAKGDGSSAAIKIRDFGELSKGLSPRRVFEEALKAKYVDARATWKLISPTVYASRHSVSIAFQKDQDDTSTATLFPTISISWNSSRLLKIEMTTVATPSEKQSESYIATIALFVLSTYLSGDDKSFLRLPGPYRDLYKECAEYKKEHDDTEARNILSGLKNLIDIQRDSEEGQDIVLTRNFLNRAKRATTPLGTVVEKNGKAEIDSERIRRIWHQKSSSPAYQRMMGSRAQLPMYQFRDAALAAIEGNQAIVLLGQTGAGKSTQLPAYIVEHQLAQGKRCKVYCTQPRRISAISLAQRVSEEFGEPKHAVGTPSSLVGYAIRLESHVSAENCLVFATVGIVLRMLESPESIDDITHLIIDEVHERSIDTDFLLIVLRSLMLKRPDLKVILMSATVDAGAFSRYLGGAPIIDVPGRTFPVNTKFLEDALEFTRHLRKNDGSSQTVTNNDDDDELSVDEKSGIPKNLQGYSASTRNALVSYDEYRIDYNLIMNLILQVTVDRSTTMYGKAFLIFLPGIAEIRQLNDMISNNSAFSDDWWILPLHSTIASDDQQRAFLIPPTGVRKIVLATNIAETGITIPDITCVIDAGKAREMRFDERRQISRLVQSFISRANAKQRRGRAGRVQEGLCFHLFTKYRHDDLMAPQQTPEMLRLSLQDLVMRTKICKLGNIEETLMQALDPPSSKNIRRAIDALIEVKALTTKEELTALGSQIAKLPLDSQLGKLVLLSSIFNCLDAGLTLAAILSSKSPFTIPFGAKQRAESVRQAFNKGDSDLLTDYNAYKTWKATCLKPGAHEGDFCRKNFLAPQNLANIEDLKAQLLLALVDAGFVAVSASDRTAISRVRNSASHHRSFVSVPVEFDTHSANDLLVSTIVATAFHPRILTRDGKAWRNIANNAPISIHPSSVLKTGASAASITSQTLLSYYSILQSSSSHHPSAHSLTPVPVFPFLLLAGDAEFKVHGRTVVFDGNRLRYTVRDTKTCVLVKMMRRGVTAYVERRLAEPRSELSRREREWKGMFLGLFDREGR